MAGRNPRKPNAVLALLAAAKKRIIDRRTADYVKGIRAKDAARAKRLNDGGGTRKGRRDD
jgi:hypothetical protein